MKPKMYDEKSHKILPFRLQHKSEQVTFIVVVADAAGADATVSFHLFRVKLILNRPVHSML